MMLLNKKITFSEEVNYPMDNQTDTSAKIMLKNGFITSLRAFLNLFYLSGQ